ncbi:uromodulin-like 1 [Menidia menidia]
MCWMFFILVAEALLALLGGENTVVEGNSLSSSGYHLCIRNETRTVSSLVALTVPYTVTQPCGGWLLWSTCTVTLYKMVHQIEFREVEEQVTRCCDGYVQVGRYCALPVNRSGEFTAKPGSCPVEDGLCPRCVDCEFDIDCPGWQKCCQRSGRSLCSDPTTSMSNTGNRGSLWNATVTVKTDYQQLMSKEHGLLNLTRLLHAMVTGALQSEVSIYYYFNSWSVHPFTTTSSLLIECSFALSMHSITSKLYFLLKDIPEVSSITVQDVDECAHTALRWCPRQADCNNTMGSYQCFCHQGYNDADPTELGVNCTADIIELPLTNTTDAPTFNGTQEPPENGTMGTFVSTENSMTTPLSNTGSATYNLSIAASETTSAAYASTSSAPGSPLPSACPPPSITSLWAANITGTSISVFWSSQFQTNQTFQVTLSKEAVNVYFLETNQTMIDMRELQPGVLYNVSVTPVACRGEGTTRHILVRTDAQTLQGTTRLTNIQFTDDLTNTSSPAYRNLTDSFMEEIYQALSPEIKEMVDLGQLRIEIRGFSMGSVVVEFSIIVSPTQNQGLSTVSTALMHSLLNSSMYTVDIHNTSISDFNECDPGNNDCSQRATCINTQGSYRCVCHDGFTDSNPEWPGRICQANATLDTTQASQVAVFTRVTTTPITQTIPSAPDPAVTHALATTVHSSSANVPTTIFTRINTSPITPIHATSTTISMALTTTMASRAITSVPTSPTTSTDTTSASTTTMTSTATTSVPTTTMTSTATTSVPTTTMTSTATTFVPTTTMTSTATTSVPTTTMTSTATTSVPTTTMTSTATTSVPTTTMTSTATASVPTTTMTSTATTSVPTTTMTSTATTSVPTTTMTSTATTSVATTTMTSTATTSVPTTTMTSTATTSVPTTTMTSTATTSVPTTTMTSTATTSVPTTTMTSTATTSVATASFPAPRLARNVSMTGALSVQCRVAAITVTVTREFLRSTKIQESALYLGMPGCGVNGGNSTHVQLTVAWDECATRLLHNETYYTAYVTLSNKMEPYTSPSGTVEVPTILLQVPIMCTYTKNMLISTDFGSMGYDMIKDVITGLGSFQVSVQLMNGTAPLPQNYSLSPEQAFVVEVSLNTTSEKIKVVINKCWATSTQNPVDTLIYTFMENSCSLNTFTHVLMNGNSTTARVSVKIFSFVNLNIVYVHCRVQICVQVGTDSCVPDCLQRTARTSNTIGTAYGSSGPLLRLYEVDMEEEMSTVHIAGFACLGIGLSLFFLFGFVGLFFYQRNRIGHYNFNTNPKPENFTYLAFNT